MLFPLTLRAKDNTSPLDILLQLCNQYADMNGLYLGAFNAPLHSANYQLQTLFNRLIV